MRDRRPRLPRRALLAGAVALLPLQACGFQPVYGRIGASQGASGQLAAIHVGLIPERAGQLLRLALQERLERGGDAVAYRYELQVTMSVVDQAIAVQQDSSVTRDRLVGTANYTLSGNDPGRPTVLTGTATRVDGFDEINQEFFAADLEREAITKRIAEGLADQIGLQLASYFHRHPSTAPA